MDLDLEFWNNPLWKWLTMASIALGGLILGRIVSAVFRRITTRSPRALVSAIGQHLAGMLVLLGLVVGMRVGLSTLWIPPDTMSMMSYGFAFAFVFILTWGLARLYEAIHQGILMPYAERDDTSIDHHLLVILRVLARTVIWILGLGSALNSAGFDISAILAALGIGGLAIALASQDTVSNIFGGVIVLTQRPFKVGERIKVAGHDGWVEEVGLRTTRIANWYGRHVSLPNKTFTDHPVENVDAQKSYFNEARFRLRHDMTSEQIETAMTLCRKVIESIDIINDYIWLSFDSIKPGSYELELWYAIPVWTRGEKQRFSDWYVKLTSAKTQFNLMIMREFQEHGIKLALPMEARISVSTDGDGLY